MKTILVLIICLTGLNACFDNKIDVPVLDPSFMPELFEKVPDTIDGCSELYRWDNTAIKDSGYVFISNMQGLGMIKIKGHTVYLIKDENRSKEISPTSYKTIYTGEGYTVTVTTITQKTVDELAYNTGTFQIVSPRLNITLKIKGEAGC